MIKNVTSATRIKGGRYDLTVGKEFLNQSFRQILWKWIRKMFQHYAQLDGVDRTFKVSTGLVNLQNFLPGNIFPSYQTCYKWEFIKSVTYSYFMLQLSWNRPFEGHWLLLDFLWFKSRLLFYRDNGDSSFLLDFGTEL